MSSNIIPSVSANIANNSEDEAQSTRGSLVVEARACVSGDVGNPAAVELFVDSTFSDKACVHV